MTYFLWISSLRMEKITEVQRSLHRIPKDVVNIIVDFGDWYDIQQKQTILRKQIYHNYMNYRERAFHSFYMFIHTYGGVCDFRFWWSDLWRHERWLTNPDYECVFEHW